MNHLMSIFSNLDESDNSILNCQESKDVLVDSQFQPVQNSNNSENIPFEELSYQLRTVFKNDNEKENNPHQFSERYNQENIIEYLIQKHNSINYLSQDTFKKICKKTLKSDAPPVITLPNLPLLNEVGLSISFLESSYLKNDIMILSLKTKSVLKFFGKIKSLSGDYLILFGLPNNNNTNLSLESVQQEELEPKGFGINKYLIYVCLNNKLSKSNWCLYT
jgi:hypothetical protein